MWYIVNIVDRKGGGIVMRVKEMRKSRGLSQSELASKLGVSRTTVAMWESNGQYPRLETVVRMASVFGCTVDELLGRPPPIEDPGSA